MDSRGAGSVRLAIQTASREQLMEVSGISDALATGIVDYFEKLRQEQAQEEAAG